MKKRNGKYGEWITSEKLGEGGNSIIWKAKNEKTGKEGALKIPKFSRKKEKFIIDRYKLRRFKNEIAIHKKACELKIPGVLTIIDSCPLEAIPDDKQEFNSKDEIPWFVMPIAQPLKKNLENCPFDKIIETFTQIAETLNTLHQNDIAHRDIKPANLLFFEKTPCLSDFGIAKFSRKREKDLTEPNRKLGPNFFLAPEMRGRGTHEADGKKADVFSFADTLWTFLTKNWLGFEGVYNPNETQLSLGTYFSKNILYEPIEKLIEICTKYSPEDRVTMAEVTEKLKSWKKKNEAFVKQKWFSKISRLLPEKASTPRKVVWKGKKTIVDVLSLISHLNHTLLPTGGGLDMTSVEESLEEGLIDLHFSGFIYRLKPESLILEYFPQAPEWSFFRLETFEIKPFDRKFVGGYDEPLTEIEPGIYSNYECWEWNNFNGKDLPESAKSIVRILKGSFVFFCKSNPYSQGIIILKLDGKSYDSYSALHEKLGEKNFRKLVYEIMNNTSKKYLSSSENISNYKFIESKKEKAGRLLSNFEKSLIVKFSEIVEQAEKEISYEEKTYSSFELLLSKEKDTKYFYWRKELINFLGKLSSKELFLIEAVMLSGRDYETYKHSYTLDEYLELTKKKKDSIIYIISKLGNLGNYLKAGLKKFSSK